MELAGSCFASGCPHFGSRAFWRENMEHLVEADRGWRYMMGEQVPESFIMPQLLGLLLPSAKTTSAGWCSWQIRCRLLEARPFSLRNVSRSCWWFCIFSVSWPAHATNVWLNIDMKGVFLSFSLLILINNILKCTDHFTQYTTLVVFSETFTCIAMKSPWVHAFNLV